MALPWRRLLLHCVERFDWEFVYSWLSTRRGGCTASFVRLNNKSTGVGVCVLAGVLDVSEVYWLCVHVILTRDFTLEGSF